MVMLPNVKQNNTNKHQSLIDDLHKLSNKYIDEPEKFAKLLKTRLLNLQQRGLLKEAEAKKIEEAFLPELDTGKLSKHDVTENKPQQPVVNDPEHLVGMPQPMPASNTNNNVSTASSNPTATNQPQGKPKATNTGSDNTTASHGRQDTSSEPPFDEGAARSMQSGNQPKQQQQSASKQPKQPQQGNQPQVDPVNAQRAVQDQTAKQSADPKQKTQTLQKHKYMEVLDDVLQYGFAKERLGKTAALGGAIALGNALKGQDPATNVLDTALSTLVGVAAAKAAPTNKAVAGGLAALATSTVVDPFLEMLMPKQDKQFNPYTGGYQ